MTTHLQFQVPRSRFETVLGGPGCEVFAEPVAEISRRLVAVCSVCKLSLLTADLLQERANF